MICPVRTAIFRQSFVLFRSRELLCGSKVSKESKTSPPRPSIAHSPGAARFGGCPVGFGDSEGSAAESSGAGWMPAQHSAVARTLFMDCSDLVSSDGGEGETPDVGFMAVMDDCGNSGDQSAADCCFVVRLSVLRSSPKSENSCRYRLRSVFFCRCPGFGHRVHAGDAIDERQRLNRLTRTIHAGCVKSALFKDRSNNNRLIRTPRRIAAEQRQRGAGGVSHRFDSSYDCQPRRGESRLSLLWSWNAECSLSGGCRLRHRAVAALRLEISRDTNFLDDPYPVRAP